MTEPTESEPEGKLCVKCQLTKPRSEFPPSKQRADGLFPYCRACKRGAQNASYANNAESRRERDRARYAENPEPRKARSRAHYAAQRDKRRGGA